MGAPRLLPDFGDRVGNKRLMREPEGRDMTAQHVARLGARSAGLGA